MRRSRYCLALAGAAVLIACGACLAAPQVPSEIPSLGAPPDTDLLPPASDAERSRAATQMLMVVVGALALIGVLLRMVGKRQTAGGGPGSGPREENAFEKARRALEEMDRRE